MWTRRNFGITIIKLTAQSRREILKSGVGFQCVHSLHILRLTDQARFLLRGFFRIASLCKWRHYYPLYVNTNGHA